MTNFTENASKVLQLANQKARERSHGYFGEEYILFGITKLGVGHAVNCLEDLGIDLNRINLEVEEIILLGTETDITSKLNKSPRARLVFESAERKASDLGFQAVGTEHLLYALVSVEDGITYELLKECAGELNRLLSDAILNSIMKLPKYSQSVWSSNEDHLSAISEAAQVGDAIVGVLRGLGFSDPDIVGISNAIRESLT